MSKRTAQGGGKQQQAELRAGSDDSGLDASELELDSSDEEYDSDVDGAVSAGQREGAAREPVDQEIEDAVLDYLGAVGRRRSSSQAGGNRDSEDEDATEASGREGGGDQLGVARDGGAADSDAVDEGSEPPSPRPAAVDNASDSSEDERPNRNTVGEVPLAWYKDEEHIGYDVEGQRLEKRPQKDKLDKLLARNDGKGLTIYDDYNDEEITLTKEEIRMLQRIRIGQFPHVEVNPYEPEVDWFTRDVEVMPLSGAPEPKRRFIPSKWEEKKVVKLVRALRKGWISREKKPEKPEVYLIWEDDGKTSDKTATGLTYIPAPKLKLPGHEESYNPPKEYLPTEEERNAVQLLDEEQRPQFVPTSYDALRRVPAYANFIKERFERCLDLYLCPRVRRKRVIINDPEKLVPQLPKPRDLQPFPTLLALRFFGHTEQVRSVAPDPFTGQWLLSGGDDGSVRLWEVRTGRCQATWHLGEPVACVAWCPSPALRLAAVVAGSRVVLLPTGNGNEEQEAATQQALDASLAAAGTAGAAGGGSLASWQRAQQLQGAASPGAVEILHRAPAKYATWHARGDYFASVAPTGNTQAVLVHQLSRGATQNPFRKNRGRVARVLFHPSKPFFFVATQQNVRVYNLAKQALAKKLVGGSGIITSMAVHPSGDHLIVGSEDKRLAWYDLDLSSKPYRALRYHNYAVRGTAFHRSYPLFASSSDDATVHVFHGMVYNDLMTNPLIVPVKILRGHEMVDFRGVLDVAFHPTQPWLFTAGADTTICMFVNP
ncbi:hypothetical protein N2152v2_003940 [Parachlorella kessleri]